MWASLVIGLALLLQLVDKTTQSPPPHPASDLTP